MSKPREGVVIPGNGSGKKPRRSIRAKNGPSEARSLERQLSVLQLSRAGHKCPEIGRRLGMDRTQAWRYLQAALEAVREEVAEVTEEWRARELDRLDALQAAAWDSAVATNPDWQAMDRVLKIMERRARLLGLDAPIRVTTPKDQPFEVAAVQSATGSNPQPIADLSLLSEAELTAQFVQAIRSHASDATSPPRTPTDAAGSSQATVTRS